MSLSSPTVSKVTDRPEPRWHPRPHNDDSTVKTYDFAYLTGIPDPTFTSRAIAALKIIFSPLVVQPLLLRTLVLIFGGCCSNVYTLESILTLSSSTGTLITFLQFVFITVYTLPTQLTFHVVSPPEPPPLQPTQRVWFPRLKRRKVPITKWMKFAAQFVAINVLNNAAFGYKISLPLHIILRSAGPVASMLVGYVWGGRRYSTQKVFAVMLLFVGVVLAALSDSGSKPNSPSGVTTQKSGHNSTIAGQASTYTTSNPPQSSAGSNQASTVSSPSSALIDQAPGFALLTLALILYAVMGIWTDKLYTQYGRNSRVADEQLFYGHLLSIPFFLAQWPMLTTQFETLLAASAAASPPPMKQSLAGLPPMAFLMHSFAGSTTQSKPLTWKDKALQLLTLERVPKALTYLFLNGITQIACISGVHHLSIQTSALTVSIVLNVRKVVSLLLSIYLFGNNLPVGVLVGALVVFLGGGVYGIPDRKEKGKRQEVNRATGKEGDKTGESKKDR